MGTYGKSPARIFLLDRKLALGQADNMRYLREFEAGTTKAFRWPTGVGAFTLLVSPFVHSFPRFFFERGYDFRLLLGIPFSRVLSLEDVVNDLLGLVGMRHDDRRKIFQADVRETIHDLLNTGLLLSTKALASFRLHRSCFLISFLEEMLNT